MTFMLLCKCKYGGEIGFDGGRESGVASRCSQATQKVATKINADNNYALAA